MRKQDTLGCVCVHPFAFWSERQERLYCLLPSRQVFSGLQLNNYRKSAHVSMKQGLDASVLDVPPSTTTEFQSNACQFHDIPSFTIGFMDLFYWPIPRFCDHGNQMHILKTPSLYFFPS